MKRPLRVLGLMSGTSLDGLDCALCQIGNGHDMHLQPEAFASFAMPAELKAALHQQLNPESSSVDGLCRLNVTLAQWMADCVQQFLANQILLPTDVDLIGSHGQTLWHDAPTARQAGASLQLGDGSWLAQLTGITTICNFRQADLAVGGHGAPLVPFLEQSILSPLMASDQAIAWQNIGGMANLSWRGPDGQWLSFDTGPGNALMDGAMQALCGQPYDAGGALATQGQVQHDPLTRWLALPFFHEPPPRSTGRELFGQRFLAQALEQMQGLPPEDILATLSALTVQSIARAYKDFVPQLPAQILVSGGGVHNTHLMQGLQQALSPVEVRSLAELGWNPDAKEALAFALMAYCCLRGWPSNVPAATGAREAVVQGQIAPGQNWPQLLQWLQT